MKWPSIALLALCALGIGGCKDEWRIVECTACLRERPDACDTAYVRRVNRPDDVPWEEIEPEAADLAVGGACSKYIHHYCMDLIRDHLHETFTVQCTRSTERRGRPLFIWH